MFEFFYRKKNIELATKVDQTKLSRVLSLLDLTTLGINQIENYFRRLRFYIIIRHWIYIRWNCLHGYWYTYC